MVGELQAWAKMMTDSEEGSKTDEENNETEDQSDSSDHLKAEPQDTSDHTIEGEVVQKEYAEFAEWCEVRSRNAGFAFKTGQAVAESLKPSVAEEASTIGSLTTKDEDRAASQATGDQDSKADTKIPYKEAADEEYASTNCAKVEQAQAMLARVQADIDRIMEGDEPSRAQKMRLGDLLDQEMRLKKKMSGLSLR